MASSGSSARRFASAMIAKIPYPLARWIAEVYKPEEQSDACWLLALRDADEDAERVLAEQSS